MILKRINFPYLSRRVSNRFIESFILTDTVTTIELQKWNHTTNKLTYILLHNFSSYSPGNTPQMKITYLIQKAQSIDQLYDIFNNYQQVMNYIHRTVFLQKVTTGPFDTDDELIEAVISQIKYNWKSDFAAVEQKNSRALANTICYMSRKRKFHHLDQQFIQIDYNQLAQHLNEKQFVMTINGLLKLQLIDKVQQHNQKFSLQSFVTENVSQTFIPPLLVSIWFNILKYDKSSNKINDFFANLLKTKHFKNNLIDYMQIVFCYVNSQGHRSVDLTYPVMTHPKELNEKSRIGAHQLSVLYDQLAKLKKIKDVYFGDEFNELLQTCYLRILNQRNIPLRNVANVFNSLIAYQNPTGKTVKQTYFKYFTVLKHEISALQKLKPGQKFRINVDTMSFANLFSQLLENYQPQNTFLNELISISLQYIEKIISNPQIMNQTMCNERTFMKIIYALNLANKMSQDKKLGNRKIQLNDVVKFGLQKQIIKRNFIEFKHLHHLMNFAQQFDMKSKQLCHKFKRILQGFKELQKYPQINQSLQQRFKQKCILNKNGQNCKNCFSK